MKDDNKTDFLITTGSRSFGRSMFGFLDVLLALEEREEGMTDNIDYSLIPKHMINGVILYLEKGKLPGSFLTSILENNLVESIARADHININRIVDWARFLYLQMPVGSWGSKEKVRKWIDSKNKIEKEAI